MFRFPVRKENFSSLNHPFKNSNLFIEKDTVSNHLGEKKIIFYRSSFITIKKVKFYFLNLLIHIIFKYISSHKVCHFKFLYNFLF